MCSLFGGFFGALNGRQVPANASGDPCRSVLDRVPRQVCVSGGRLHLGGSEQVPEDREALAQSERP